MNARRIAPILLLLLAPAAAAAPGGEWVNVIIDRPSFSPNGDGVADSAVVRLIVPAAIDSLLATIHHEGGGEIDELLYLTPVPAGEYPASWHGTDILGEPLPDGVYELRVRARAGGSEETIVRDLVVDRVAPGVSIDRIEPGVFAPGAAGSPDSIAVYLTLSDWSDGTTLSATATAPEGDPETIDLPAGVSGEGGHRFAWVPGGEAADGIWSILLSATDEAGNTGTDEGLVEIDVSGPAIAFVDSIPPSSREPSTVVTGRCFDRAGVAEPVFVVTRSGYTSPDTPPDSTWTAGDTLYWRVDILDHVTDGGEFVEGAYTFKAICADGLGNETEHTFTFGIDRTAPAAPVLVQPLSPVGDPALEIEVETDADEVDSVFVYRMAGGETEVFAKRASLSSFTVEVTLVEGTNTFRAYAQDEAGNVSYPSNGIEVVLDTSAGVSFPEAFRGPDVFVVRTAQPAREVTIDIYDIAGGRVRTLETRGSATAYTIGWDLLNDDGEEVNNGPFLCVITVDGRSEKHFIAVVRGE